MRSARALHVLVLSAWALAACVPRHVVAPAAGARLAVGAESFADDGPFRVAFAGPKGESPDPREVTISFSRPMRALAPLDEGPVTGPAPAVITRAHDGTVVAGTWRWFGERTAVFWPTVGFDSATEFRVAVDEHARALDGSTLAKTDSLSFTFASTRPGLGSVSHEYDPTADQHLLTLSFTQAMDHAEIRRAIRIEGRRGPGKPLETVPYHVIGEGPVSLVRLHVDRRIAALEDVTVVAAPSLRSVEGPLASLTETREKVEGVGPLRAGIECGDESGERTAPARSVRCAANAQVILRFSDTVQSADIERHLVVSPPAKMKPEEDQRTDTITLSDRLTLTPGRKYRFTVKAGVQRDDNEVLTSDQVLDVEIADEVPSVAWRDIGREAVVESARPTIGLHLATMNIPALEAVRAPLDDDSLVDVLLGNGTSAARIRALPGSSPVRIDVKSARNGGAAAKVELPPAMRAPGMSGLFAVATSTPGLADDVHVLSVTDLGVSATWSPHGGLVWVTRLSTGEPVSNAAVSLVRAWRPASDGEHATSSDALATRTDPDGLAAIPSQVAATFLAEQEGSEALLHVREGADRTYTRLPRLDPRVSRVLGALFTDRLIYRPGETAFVKGIFRAPTARGLVSLAGRPATIEAVDAEDRVMFSTTATLDAFGSFSCELPIPRTARLGYTSVHARIGGPVARPAGGRWNRWADVDWPARTKVVVDEFRTPEFEVKASSDRAEARRSESARISINGKYLLGAPMHDIPVELSAMRSPATFHPPGLEGFTTDPYGLVSLPSTAAWTDVRAMPKDLRLGKDGSASLLVPLALPAQLGPETVRIDASISDVSGAFASGDSASVLVHNADLYVGVRASADAAVVAGKSVRAEILAASVDGTRRTGVPVRVELLREPRDSPMVTTGRSCELRTTTNVASCEIEVTESGSHWLRASAVDGAGRAVLSAARFYAGVPSKSTKPPPPPPPPPPPAPPPLPFDEACRALPQKNASRSIEVEGDAWGRTFEVGRTAHVCLRGSGATLLTFEREGVLRHETYRLGDRGRVLDIPITADLAPNVRLTLHSVTGRTAPFPSGTHPRADFGHPDSSRSSVDLRIAAAETKLTVGLEMQDEYRPGSEIEARVRVADASGRPAQAQVTLWAVDEGVVMLQPFHVPELHERFSQEREIDVVETDSRDRLLWEKVGMHMVRAPSLRQGATSSGPGDHIGRAVFRPTAWFAPSLVTGPDGIAVMKARLPDNLTSWKVFAVAMTVTDGFGAAESSFRTNKPLMVRPQLPRFLRAGDHVDATVIVDSMSKEPLDVKVSMRASGAVASSATTVSSFVVPPDGHVPVRFALDARSAGHGSVTFHIEAPRAKLADDVTVAEEVTAPAAYETIVISGDTKTRARADERLGDLSRARDDVGGLDFRLSTTPMVGLGESLTQLVEYPYGCTEQLTSRLVPLVRLRGLSRELGVVLPRDVDGAVRSAVGNLLSHQRTDGGFGFWGGSSKSEPWLTVLALGALHASRDAGFPVPPAALDRASEYLAHADGLDGPSRAMLEDLFASDGHPREKELRALAAEAQAGKLPLFARALVARSLAKVDRALGAALLDGIASQAHLSGATAIVTDEPYLSSRAHLSSDARTTAMALRAFVALDPKNALVTKLVRGLLSLRRDGRWLTTQASAWALLALDEARPLFAPVPGKAATSARLSLDGAELAKATLDTAGGIRSTTFTGTIPMARFAAAPGATLSFTSDGAPLFYEGALRYARREPPKKPLENGIYVNRTMRLIGHDGEATATPTFHVGDYVRVEVMLASPVTRELVVLDDPIPAGFEAVNQRFANVDRAPFQPDMAVTYVTQRELRDDRVVSFFDELPAGQVRTSYVLRVVSGGAFVVPPAKAECMYAPDVFGRTATSVVTSVP